MSVYSGASQEHPHGHPHRKHDAGPHDIWETPDVVRDRDAIDQLVEDVKEGKITEQVTEHTGRMCVCVVVDSNRDEIWRRK